MMILAGIIALPLATGVMFDPQPLEPQGNGILDPQTETTLAQKHALMRPLVRSATQCVVHAVSSSPRLAQTLKAGEITELIVEAMAPCAGVIRTMIQAHDRLFGHGSGEAFFMGPYLDALPSTVSRTVGSAGQALPTAAPSP